MLYPDAKANDVVLSMEKTSSRLLIVVDKLLSLYEMDLPESFKCPIVLLNVADQMGPIQRFLARKKAAYLPQNHNLHTIKWSSFINGGGKTYKENHDATIPAFMLRTGGTTGIPKETVLNSRNFNAITEGAYRANICKHWERQKKDILLCPPFIAFGIGSGIHDALCFGLQTVITLDVSPAAVSKLFLKHKPSYIIAGTVQIEHLINDFKGRKVDLSYIQMLSVGGEAMSIAFEEELRAFLVEHNCKVLPLKGYGLTETSATVIMETIDANALGSVGIPLAFCNMKIISPETGEELSYNSPGEICVSSPGIMLEYYQNQKATDEMIEIVNNEQWLHTGDIGYISEDGLLTITGRIKRIITCREGLIYHKVFPLLIENQLAKISGVQEITIVGKPSEETGNALVAFIVPAHNTRYTEVEKALKDYCNTKLESFERPKEYYCMQVSLSIRNCSALPRMR